MFRLIFFPLRVVIFVVTLPGRVAMILSLAVLLAAVALVLWLGFELGFLG